MVPTRKPRIANKCFSCVNEVSPVEMERMPKTQAASEFFSFFESWWYSKIVMINELSPLCWYQVAFFVLVLLKLLQYWWQWWFSNLKACNYGKTLFIKKGKIIETDYKLKLHIGIVYGCKSVIPCRYGYCCGCCHICSSLELLSNPLPYCSPVSITDWVDLLCTFPTIIEREKEGCACVQYFN